MYARCFFVLCERPESVIPAIHIESLVVSEKDTLSELTNRGYKIYTDVLTGQINHNAINLGDRCYVSYTDPVSGSAISILCYVVGRSTHHTKWCRPNITVKAYGPGFVTASVRLRKIS